MGASDPHTRVEIQRPVDGYRGTIVVNGWNGIGVF
jgi:hypothetical protein